MAAGPVDPGAEGRAGERRRPVFSLLGLPPAALSLLLWLGLERWAEPLGYAAPAAVALATVATVILLFGGLAAGVVGILRGERPRWLPVAAVLANAAVGVWLRSSV